MLRSIGRFWTTVVVLTAMLGLSHQALAGGEVPFKGHADVVVTGVVPQLDGTLLLTTFATGQATHLGEFTRDESVVFNPSTGTLAGTVVFTAANGDLLFADADGGFISATTAVGTYTITGGTGRFATASGVADWVGVTTDGIHVAVSFDGTINF